MLSLSLVLTLMLLNSSLLISASHDRDDHHHHHDDDDDDDDDGCGRSTETETVCEGYTLHLVCHDHAKIKILAANYGRTDRRTCSDNRPQDQIQNTDCKLRRSLSIVSGSCDGRESCSVPATNDVFSDPCYGTYKYLKVKYCCKRRR